MGNQPLDLFPECRTEPLHMSSQEPAWRRLWELAEVMLGSLDVLKTECAILARLYRRFGAPDVERMLQGAMLMRWSSLTSLGSADGLGRRMALARYWQDQQKRPVKLPERVRAILRSLGDPTRDIVPIGDLRAGRDEGVWRHRLAQWRVEYRTNRYGMAHLAPRCIALLESEIKEFWPTRAALKAVAP